MDGVTDLAVNGGRAVGVLVTAPPLFALVGLCAWWYGRKLRARLLRTAAGTEGRDGRA